MQDLENDGPNRWKMTDHLQRPNRNSGSGKCLLPNSNIMKILLLVHSAVNLQGRKIRTLSVSVKRGISHPGMVVRLALRHACILAYTHTY